MKLKELYINLLKEAKNNDIPELDIRELISFYQNFEDSSSFFLNLDNDAHNVNLIENAFRKLIDGIPLAYITNQTNFLGEKFYIDNNVLIPRVETEELVVLAISRIIQHFPYHKNINVLDVGTGSGAIAILLKKRLSDINMYATDISERALNVAKINAKNFATKINFYHVDTFPINEIKFDVIISNPPYIKKEIDAEKSVVDNEPHDALFLKENNNVYLKILSDKLHRNSPCLMIFEISPDLESDLKKMMSNHLDDFAFNFSKDINGKVRFLTIFTK